MNAKAPIVFYYGAGRLDELRHYRRVVLQPEFYRLADLRLLRIDGTEPLAYLSLSEDQGPPAPWQRPERNPDRGGAFVYAGHPEWSAHVVGQARAALEAGFAGLFLDTLNVELTYPEDLPHLLRLVATLRAAAGRAYILANRGFGLLPGLAEHVDGILFESFSAHWTGGGYGPWPADILAGHARIAEDLPNYDLDLFALDYADTPGLADFARRRAALFGMHCVISDRALSWI
ncbi:hypothetical protein [Dactylosporangium sp. CA-092794]|uniref:hypothetical protein n=1 Tax=Dactylosporangium sp. CA-092794 TaxID=3239929 RepID=UPI003D93E913